MFEANQARILDVVADWSVESIKGDPEVVRLLKSLERTWAYASKSFHKDAMPIIDHAINCYGPLPGSQADHHSGKNGLIIHSLDLALRALRSIPGETEPGEAMKGSNRAHHELGYYVVILLIALLHDVGKPITDYVVRDLRDHDRIWYPWHQSLVQFCRDGNSWAIGWQWQAGRHGQHERFIQIMAGAWIEHLGIKLSEANLKTFCAAIERLDSSIEWEIIKKLDGDSARDAKLVESSYHGGVGSALDAMRAAVTSLFYGRTWVLNEPGNPVWWTEEGLFLIYPVAFRHILDELRRTSPNREESRFRVEDQVLDKMIDAGVVEKYINSAGEEVATQLIMPSTLKKGANALYAVHITQPQSLNIATSIAEPVALRFRLDNLNQPIPEQPDKDDKAAESEGGDAEGAGDQGGESGQAKKPAKKAATKKSAQKTTTKKSEKAGPAPGEKKAKQQAGNKGLQPQKPADEAGEVVKLFWMWLLEQAGNGAVEFVEVDKLNKDHHGAIIAVSGEDYIITISAQHNFLGVQGLSMLQGEFQKILLSSSGNKPTKHGVLMSPVAAKELLTIANKGVGS